MEKNWRSVNLTTNKELNDKIVTLITKVNNLDKRFMKLLKTLDKIVKALEEE